MSEAIESVAAPALTVECKNCIQMQLEFLFDDLWADAHKAKGWQRLKLKRQAKKVRQAARDPEKVKEIEEFVGNKAYSYHLAQGNVGAFGDGSIIEWFQNGGLDQLLTFILGIMKGIADLFLILPYILLCIAMTL